MDTRPGLMTCLLLLALSGMAWAQRPVFQPSPPFTGDRLPTPPQQEAAWEPPARLSAPLISATTALFDTGLADPRGGEYREIEVGTGSCWSGDAGVVKTHGWVLPATQDEQQRYAVCWNGLVYPVVAMGEKADLQADIQDLLKTEEDRRAEYLRKSPGFSYHNWYSNRAFPEGLAIAFNTPMPGKVCLLLRLGEGKLAEQYWTAMMAGLPERTNNNDVARKDPYLLLASEWVWALFDRTVCAHMRGDDRLALLSARALGPIQQAVESEAAKRGFERPPAIGDLAELDPVIPYLTFLKPLPILLGEQERRAKAPPNAITTVEQAIAEKDQKQRIALLIRLLEEVSERQDGQPGGVTLASDLVIKALIIEGEEAVDALITCLENDTRLTRSVGFGRDFFHDRRFITVRSAAYTALAGIFRTSEFGAEMRSTPQEMAARLRAYWTKYRGVPLEERWYRTLVDDAATPKQWMEAIKLITQPVNITNVPASNWISEIRVKPGEQPPMRGESLRGKKDPSVSELMAKRIAQLAARKEGNSNDLFMLADTVGTALAFADWDGQAAVPTLQELSRHCRMAKDYRGMINGRMAGSLAQLTLARARNGDPMPWDDYYVWIRSCKPDESLNDNLSVIFKPLWFAPDEPTMRETAAWLFTDPGSLWAKPDNYKIIFSGFSPLGQSPILGVVSFREYLLKGLADTTAIGAATLRADGRSLDIRYATGSGSGSQIDSKDTHILPKAGEAFPVRICDLVAWHLSSVEGMPDCQVYWPEKDRDEAITAIAAFLQQYGEHYRYNPNSPKEFYQEHFGSPKARLVFPRLEQPATQDDVTKGLAIFALSATVEKRTVPLSALPQAAIWTTLKKYPYDQQSYNTQAGKSETKIAYRQNVTIWQAEEALIDGKWQRFYGVVGPHELAKVPAAEIELVLGDSWRIGRLSHGVGCQVQLQDGHIATSGMPIPVNVTLYNHSGVAQRIPTELLRQGVDGKPALREGVTLILEYLGSTTALPNRSMPPRRERLTPKLTATFHPNDADKVFAAGEGMAVARLDLNNWFDLNKLGRYQLHQAFTQASGIAEGNSNYFYFELHSPPQ
ncbi:MAG: hypothetical protein ACYC7E_03165 [Armatimonadota bacterium]